MINSNIKVIKAGKCVMCGREIWIVKKRDNNKSPNTSICPRCEREVKKAKLTDKEENVKKIRLFSTKAIKSIEGIDDKAELYVNFYLVLDRDYIFTFLIDAPNLSCSDRHPIKLWKHFLIMLEEEYVKYMCRYERCRKWG